MGAGRISRLNELQAKEGDLDKLLRANTDKEYREKLLRKYNPADGLFDSERQP